MDLRAASFRRFSVGVALSVTFALHGCSTPVDATDPGSTAPDDTRPEDAPESAPLNAAEGPSAAPAAPSPSAAADSGTTETPDGGGTATPPPFATDVRVAATGGSTCAVSATGKVYCWGDNWYGEVGLPNSQLPTQPTPRLVPLPERARRVALSSSHACAVLESGALSCWGTGELGNGVRSTNAPPTTVPIAGVTDVAAGWLANTCVVASGGVACWGAVIGNGASPTWVIPAGSGATAVTIAWGHACAVVNAKVKCWGSNSEGELGDGTRTSRSTPVDVVGLSNVTDLATGGATNCAIAGGSVLCWGYGVRSALPVARASGAVRLFVSNGGGDFGFVDAAGTLDEVLGSFAAPNAALASGALGAQHRCGVTPAGAILCWGHGTGGMLGDGTTWDRPASAPATISLP